MANPFSSLLSRFVGASGDTPEKEPRFPSSVRAQQALELVADGATLIDVREPGEWRAGHAPRAIHIPLAQVPTQIRRLSPDRPVVVMCQSGSRSRVAASELRKAGSRPACPGASARGRLPGEASARDADVGHWPALEARPPPARPDPSG